MNKETTSKGGNGVDFAEATPPITLIKQHYEARDGDERKILISVFLRPSQKNLIDDLAANTGRGKAKIIRGIIDEWCQSQLEKAEESG